jgi:hypothetical protein
MGRKATGRPLGKRWRDRAEEIVVIAQTIPHLELRAQLERLAENWRLAAAVEDATIESHERSPDRKSSRGYPERNI